MPQQEVQHGRIARRHHAVDVAASDLGALHEVVDQRVDVVEDRPLEGLGAAGLPGIVDAADDVGAVLDLGVVLGGRLAGDAGAEVHQVPDDGGRAHVQRQAEVPLRGVAPLHAEHLVDVAAAAHRGRHPAVPLPRPRRTAGGKVTQHARQFPRGLQSDLQRAGPLLGHRLQQALLVGRGVVQRRLGKNEEELLHQRVRVPPAAARHRCGQNRGTARCLARCRRSRSAGIPAGPRPPGRSAGTAWQAST